MNKNREGFLVSDTERQCTNCLQIYKRTSLTVTLCPACNSGRVKTQSAQIKMFRRAKSRAKSRGLEFNLEVDDIQVPEICPILHIPLIVNSGKSGAYVNSPSLDRIDNSKGYIKGNVWVISQRANAMKADANVEMLKKFAAWINTIN